MSFTLDPFFLRDLYSWSDKTFGINRDPEGPLNHLKEEVDEILEDPTDISEFADVALLLLDSLRCAGHSEQDLEAAMEYKFYKILVKRKYGPPDSKGVSRHIKEELR